SEQQHNCCQLRCDSGNRSANSRPLSAAGGSRGDSANQPVALTTHDLDVARVLRVLADGVAQQFHALADRLLTDWTAAPDNVRQLVIGDDMGCCLDQNQQQPPGEGAQVYGLRTAPQLLPTRIQGQVADTVNGGHWQVPVRSGDAPTAPRIDRRQKGPPLT